MRLKNTYIFIIILSLLMPETTSENTDPSTEEKKGWSLFKRKNKEIKEKSDRKGFLGIFKRKPKNDGEEDLIVTEESDEVLSSIQSGKEDIPKSIPEEFYYWIGIALFYLLSSIFKKREQQADGAEKKSSENTSLKSFLQNSLQIDTQRDIFRNLKNEPVIENTAEETNLIEDKQHHQIKGGEFQSPHQFSNSLGLLLFFFARPSFETLITKQL